MIYLVSKQKQFFDSPNFTIIDKKEALDMIISHTLVEYDSETEGLDPYTKALLCIQFGLGEDQIVVDTTSIDVEYFRPVFENPEITLLGWNLCFDLKFLYRHKIVPTKVYDGMIVERLLYMGYPSQFHSLSLKSACDYYLNIDLDKSVRGQIITKGLTDSVLVYAAHDVIYINKIREKQLADAKKKDLLKAIKFENLFVSVCAYIEYCGATIDTDKWKQKMAKDLEGMETHRQLINKWVEDFYAKNKVESPDPKWKGKPCVKISKIISPKKENEFLNNLPEGAFNGNREILEDKRIKYTFGVPFGYRDTKGWNPYMQVNLQGDLFSGFDTSPKCVINWDSSKQVIPLFEMLGIDCNSIDPKTKKANKSVGIKKIKPQSSKCSIIEPYIKFKEDGQVVKSFGQKFLDLINPVSHRIHANFHQLGTDTGRLSSQDPNLQNLPHDPFTRSCFVARKGYKWLSCDYSGQESFLMASIANDRAMLDELNYGSADMHSVTAKLVFKDQIPQDMPTKDIKKKFHDLRQAAKGYEFCFNYDGSAATLVQNYGIPMKEAKRIEQAYEEGFSGLAAYKKRQHAFVLKNGYILLNPITGHKAFIYDWKHLEELGSELNSLEGQHVIETRDTRNPMWKDYEFLTKRLRDSQKQAVNYPIQGSGALCFKLASIYLFKYLKEHDLLFKVMYCIPAHDEINIEVPNEHVEEMQKVLLDCMERGAKPFCTRAHLVADMSVGDFWIH